MNVGVFIEIKKEKCRLVMVERNDMIELFLFRVSDLTFLHLTAFQTKKNTFLYNSRNERISMAFQCEPDGHLPTSDRHNVVWTKENKYISDYVYCLV